MIKVLLKKYVLSIPFLKNIYINNRETNNIFINEKDLNISGSNPIMCDIVVDNKTKVGLVKDGLTDIEGYIEKRAYYPKYERFFNNNEIQYDYYNIHSHNWIEEANKYDIIVWRTHSAPAIQVEASQKIYFLESIGKICFPSFEDVFKYEDKVAMHYFYKSQNLPEIPTFVSCLETDAIEFINKAKYPLISKVTTGSSSNGVDIIKSKKEARRLVKSAFSYKGRKIYWNYLRQKNYVYFQEFIDDAEYDLRVVVVGNSLFGYYRYPNKGDFRASGSGNYEKKEIEKRALDIAWETKEKYNTHCLATDFVYSSKDDKYYIIESSIFIGIDTDEQLMIDGIAGRYVRDSNGEYTFEAGKFWIQELALKSFFESLDKR